MKTSRMLPWSAVSRNVAKHASTSRRVVHLQVKEIRLVIQAVVPHISLANVAFLLTQVAQLDELTPCVRPITYGQSIIYP